MHERPCSSCQSYVEPPENYRGRPDIGFCPEVGERVHENDSCGCWQKKQEV